MLRKYWWIRTYVFLQCYVGQRMWPSPLAKLITSTSVRVNRWPTTRSSLTSPLTSIIRDLLFADNQEFTLFISSPLLTQRVEFGSNFIKTQSISVLCTGTHLMVMRTRGIQPCCILITMIRWASEPTKPTTLLCTERQIKSTQRLQGYYCDPMSQVYLFRLRNIF